MNVSFSENRGLHGSKARAIDVPSTASPPRRWSAQPTRTGYCTQAIFSLSAFVHRLWPRLGRERFFEVPLHGHAIMDLATQRRCQWAGWSHPVPQPTARHSLHAPKHVWLIHRVCVTRALGSRAQVEAAAVFGAPVVCLAFKGGFGVRCARVALVEL